MIWYWIVFGIVATYGVTGLIYREIKVERVVDKMLEYNIRALNLSRWPSMTGESMHYAMRAQRQQRIMERNAKTMRIFWPFL